VREIERKGRKREGLAFSNSRSMSRVVGSYIHTNEDQELTCIRVLSMGGILLRGVKKKRKKKKKKI